MKMKNWFYIVAVILLILIGLYFGNIAIFNLWQSAFEVNVPYLENIELRFWLFLGSSIVFISLGIGLLVKIIKKVNRSNKNTNIDGSV